MTQRLVLGISIEEFSVGWKFGLVRKNSGSYSSVDEHFATKPLGLTKTR